MALQYLSGFGNEFATEALPGALPVGQNSPQKCAYGLYAEQLSGTPFTAPRHNNARTWMYRIRPSVRHVGAFTAIDLPDWKSAPIRDEHAVPLGPLRWNPAPMPEESLNFLEGIRTMTGAGDVRTQTGFAAHIFFATRSMTDEYFYNADAEMLIVPEAGQLRFCTELGILEVTTGDIAVLPRGMKFRVEVGDATARGFICENYGAAFRLPELGPIGANGLANPRDFLTPTAAYEEKEDHPARMIVKWCGQFHAAEINHSPLDVVAWHGSYVPYKYDLRQFSPVGSILFDHPDPSIFTVLTSPTDTAGTANVDFVIFPERWLVAEHSFRPPWYHMNVMSEFMGLIYGVYDAKPEGFVPGGMSLHNCMLPHGPDAEAFEKASSASLTPMKLSDTLAFMFETRYPQQLTKFAAELPTRQAGYQDVWNDVTRHFDPEKP